MKARLAKKIIKSSGAYCFYCRNCDTHSRFKYYPYWSSRWNHNGFQMGDVPSATWTFDQRLNAALRRLPQYTQKLSSAVEAKLMEIKRNMYTRCMNVLIAQQAVRKETVMGRQIFPVQIESL